MNIQQHIFTPCELADRDAKGRESCRLEKPDMYEPCLRKGAASERNIKIDRG